MRNAPGGATSWKARLPRPPSASLHRCIPHKFVPLLSGTLAERYAPTTANRHLAAPRGVLKECWRPGYVGVEDYQRAPDLEPVRGSRLLRGRALDGGEVKALFDECGDDAHAAIGSRDAAILAVLYGAGLRRAEAVGLRLRDYDRRKGTLKVRGKGNKERLAYVGAGVRAAIEDWLELRGGAAGPLFRPVHRSGRVGPARRLTAQAVLYLARRRGADTQIQTTARYDRAAMRPNPKPPSNSTSRTDAEDEAWWPDEEGLRCWARTV
jgi:site-specific recombinase XerC